MRNRKEIYIGGTKYFVKSVDRIKKPKGMYGRNVSIYGQFRSKSNEIVFIRGLGLQKNTTIIHEVIHAIDREFGGNLKEDDVNVLSREIAGVLSQLGMLK